MGAAQVVAGASAAVAGQATAKATLPEGTALAEAEVQAEEWAVAVGADPWSH